MTSWDNLDRDLLSQSERIWVAEATGRKRTFYLDQVRCCEAYLRVISRISEKKMQNGKNGNYSTMFLISYKLIQYIIFCLQERDY